MLSAAKQLLGLSEAAATPERQGDTRDDAPILSWDNDGSRIYLEIDCIPTITDSHPGTVTDFALEDGSSVADHFVRKPQVITLEINQTTTPTYLKTNPKSASPDMKLENISLKIEPNKFKASGLLLLRVGVEAVVTKSVNAIGGALGLGSAFPGDKPPLAKDVLVSTDTSVNRINRLYDDLIKARERAAQFQLEWLGRTWGPLVIENFRYTRSTGRQLGVFNLDLKRVAFVRTAQASALQLPSVLTMKPPVSIGSALGSAASAAQKSQVAGNPALAAQGL